MSACTRVERGHKPRVEHFQIPAACLHIPSTNEEFESRDPTRGSKETPSVSLNTMLNLWHVMMICEDLDLGVFPLHIKARIYLQIYTCYLSVDWGS